MNDTCIGIKLFYTYVTSLSILEWTTTWAEGKHINIVIILYFATYIYCTHYSKGTLTLSPSDVFSGKCRHVRICGWFVQKGHFIAQPTKLAISLIYRHPKEVAMA